MAAPRPRVVQTLLVDMSRCAGRKDVKLLSVKIDGKALSGSDYELTPESLTISSPPSGTFQVR